MKPVRRYAAAIAAIVTSTAGLMAGSGMFAEAANASSTFTGPLNTISTLASTVPANGDVNPYGVAVVPRSTGNLHQGSVLVSNFNAASNIQGTGTTIVQVTPGGHMSQFAQIGDLGGACPGGVGLTTALSVLRSGWVIVGSLPTTQLPDGTTVISGSGCLIVLDSHGTVRETFKGHGINGPWDMTALDLGGIAELFVTNVLNGTVAAGGSTVNGGTVLRLVITAAGLPRLLNVTRIGSGFPETLNNAALVIGPTGVGLGANGTLYVADTLSNRIAAIPGAVLRLSDDGAGTTVSAGRALNGELGLTVAPGGDIVTVNGGDGNLVEVTPGGAQVVVKNIDPNGAGAGDLFGLAIKPGADAVYFVNDGTNTLNLLH
jgi:hypothetical protein